MLELDLILAHFVQRRLAGLDEVQLRALDTLLTYPDNELFELVMGRKACNDARLRPVVDLIRAR